MVSKKKNLISTKDRTVFETGNVILIRTLNTYFEAEIGQKKLNDKDFTKNCKQKLYIAIPTSV